MPRVQDPRYGTAEVRVAVRLTRPLVIEDSVRDAGVLEDLTRRAGTEDFRDAILAAGFDGVVVHYGEQRLVVAFHSEQVKVVLEGTGDE